MATLFVLVLFLAVIGVGTVELIEAGGVRNHVPSKVRKYKED